MWLLEVEEMFSGTFHHWGMCVWKRENWQNTSLKRFVEHYKLLIHRGRWKSCTIITILFFFSFGLCYVPCPICFGNIFQISCQRRKLKLNLKLKLRIRKKKERRGVSAQTCTLGKFEEFINQVPTSRLRWWSHWAQDYLLTLPPPLNEMSLIWYQWFL